MSTPSTTPKRRKKPKTSSSLTVGPSEVATETATKAHSSGRKKRERKVKRPPPASPLDRVTRRLFAEEEDEGEDKVETVAITATVDDELDEAPLALRASVSSAAVLVTVAVGTLLPQLAKWASRSTKRSATLVHLQAQAETEALPLDGCAHSAPQFWLGVHHDLDVLVGPAPLGPNLHLLSLVAEAEVDLKRWAKSLADASDDERTARSSLLASLRRLHRAWQDVTLLASQRLEFARSLVKDASSTAATSSTPPATSPLLLSLVQLAVLAVVAAFAPAIAFPAILGTNATLFTLVATVYLTIGLASGALHAYTPPTPAPPPPSPAVTALCTAMQLAGPPPPLPPPPHLDTLEAAVRRLLLVGTQQAMHLAMEQEHIETAEAQEQEAVASLAPGTLDLVPAPSLSLTPILRLAVAQCNSTITMGLLCTSVCQVIIDGVHKVTGTNEEA